MRAALPLAGLLLLAGCPFVGTSDDASVRHNASRNEVLLTFTRDARPGARPDVQFTAQGHFARFRLGDGRRAATLLGLAHEDDLPLDSCSIVDGAEELDRAFSGEPAEVELLDAGRLLVRGPLGATMLQPRRYPELTPEVTGSVYTVDESTSSSLVLEPGALYDVVGEGGEEIGPFSASVTAPRAFPSLEAPVLRRGSELELRWSAGDSPDPIVATVAWSSKAGAREVRCRLVDDGSFMVPRGFLLSLPPASQLAHAEVTMTRVRRSRVSAPGAGPSSVAIALRDLAPLVTEER